ncbi:hypothetical protein [Labrys wisconsinensis]|uniref:Uncharacterized protein n=1 Tax=Labrys wisconsinensis TaxID=425677 RepID=A0ABU0JFA4_9HYPH|nr:hypothetical protein [Labrys wisconsinensis]MDQ0472954.1 hypothetical protein [Labrys wisconsinensis]
MADFTLLNAAAATGGWSAVQGCRYSWRVYGTWAGATAQLQVSPDGGTTAINVDDAVLTADGG